MPIYKVTETWNRIHTDTERQNMIQYIGELLTEADTLLDNNILKEEFIPNNVDTQKTIKRFPDEVSAKKYVDFVANLDPKSITIEVEN